MPDGLFEVESSPTMHGLAQQLTADDEAELGRIITLLRVSPWPDGVLKFSLQLGEGTGPALGEVSVYNDGEWTVIYRVAARMIQLLDAWRTQDDVT